MNEKRIYAIKDMRTGKLVYNLTRRHKKWYESERNAKLAISNKHLSDREKANLKVVAFKLEEVSDDD